MVAVMGFLNSFLHFFWVLEMINLKSALFPLVSHMYIYTFLVFKMVDLMGLVFRACLLQILIWKWLISCWILFVNLISFSSSRMGIFQDVMPLKDEI